MIPTNKTHAPLFICCLISITLLLLSGCAYNKQLSDESYDLVFKEVRLFDGYRLHPQTSVYISNGRIKRVEKGYESVEGKEVEIIEGKGKTLLPALINAHVHVVEPSQLVEAAQAGVLTLIDLFNIDLENMKRYQDSVGYAQLVSAGICVTAPKGHGTQYGIDIPTLDSAKDALRFVKDRKAEGSDFIKIILEQGYPFNRVPTLSDTIFRSVVSAAKELNLISVVHVSDLDDGMMAFRSGADGLAHLWTKGKKTITNAQLQEISRRPFFVTPTLQVLKRSLSKWRKKVVSLNFIQMQEEVKKLQENNVQILAGTDPPNYGINYGTDLYEELEDFVAAGLTPIESIQTATSSPAKVFQLKNIGIIKPGALANVLLVDGDPTTNISDIRKIIGVWQKGEKLR